MMLPRVVVTGMGVVSPVGLNVPDMWKNLAAGRSGIRPITLFDPTPLDVRFAGEAHGFNPIDYMSAKEARRSDRFTQLALAAWQQAQSQSGLLVNAENADQIGVIVGAGIGGITTYTRDLDALREKGPNFVNPFLLTMISSDVAAAQIALRNGARGPNLGISSACASGADAIGQAFNTIRMGCAKAMIAGGCEAGITQIALAALQRMRALSRNNENPAAASRPFDKHREGFVVSEGGAVLVLEELNFALARGAPILAEVAGYANTSDATHVAAPDPEGFGSARCMALAMERAGFSAADVSYINAHGTGTPLGDLAETKAIKCALGEHAYRVPISATKSMTGHLMGGAGALEAVISIEALRTGLIPPTINLDEPDPACDLDYVPLKARQADVEVVLTNSFGFGGHNAVLAFKRFRS
jgi:3-oxoacyl-[acyl-carrier-protein] synthase II